MPARKTFRTDLAEDKEVCLQRLQCGEGTADSLTKTTHSTTESGKYFRFIDELVCSNWLLECPATNVAK